MNYLAHIYLSGKKSQTQIGNFIGDFVKGNSWKSYPEKIADGILLHRRIDEYTDQHPAVKELKLLLRPYTGRYAGIVADMLLDHFLAAKFKPYTHSSLRLLSIKFYCYLFIYYRYLPERVKSFVFHFVYTDRLTKYASKQGLLQSLLIMNRHKIPDLNILAIETFLEKDYEKAEQLFARFYPDILNFATTELSKKSKIHSSASSSRGRQGTPPC